MDRGSAVAGVPGFVGGCGGGLCVALWGGVWAAVLPSVEVVGSPGMGYFLAECIDVQMVPGRRGCPSSAAV